MNNNEMLHINFEDENMKKCLRVFNALCENYYPDIKQWDHVELSQMSQMLNENIPPFIWRNFLLNDKVKEWYDEEQAVEIRKKINILLSKADTNNTAQQQTLNNLLTQSSKSKQSENKTIIIYNCFVPLSEDEKENPNVKKINSIPDAISNAIQDIDDF